VGAAQPRVRETLQWRHRPGVMRDSSAAATTASLRRIWRRADYQSTCSTAGVGGGAGGHRGIQPASQFGRGGHGLAAQSKVRGFRELPKHGLRGRRADSCPTSAHGGGPAKKTGGQFIQVRSRDILEAGRPARLCLPASGRLTPTAARSRVANTPPRGGGNWLKHCGALRRAHRRPADPTHRSSGATAHAFQHQTVLPDVV